jgi:ferrous iron transport protein A
MASPLPAPPGDRPEPGVRPALLRLTDLRPGETAEVVAVSGDDAIGRRLLDLGLLPGTPVTVMRRAPLGDPVVYELRGYRLCLRRSEAARISVRRRPAPAA